MTDKVKFVDALKYGRCLGNDNSPILDNGKLGCVRGNSAHAPRSCGFDYKKTCNCCDYCRNVCVMMKIIRDSVKEQTELNFEKLIKKC